MTDNEKLEKLKKLADAMYYAAQYLTTDASRLHKAMEKYHKFIIHECKKEPKECMYSKDNYTDEDRKALYDGCETECRFNKKKEPVSEDLEEFINTIKLLTSNTALLTFEYGCREGAKWQKQQDQSTIELAEDHAMLAGMEKMKEEMMAKAVDAVVKVDAGGYPYVDSTIELYDYDKDIPLAKKGDKVKILVIREE